MSESDLNLRNSVDFYAPRYCFLQQQTQSRIYVERKWRKSSFTDHPSLRGTNLSRYATAPSEHSSMPLEANTSARCRRRASSFATSDSSASAAASALDVSTEEIFELAESTGACLHSAGRAPLKEKGPQRGLPPCTGEVCRGARYRR